MFEAIRFIVGFIMLVVLTSFFANSMQGADGNVILLCIAGILTSIYGFYRVCIGPLDF